MIAQCSGLTSEQEKVAFYKMQILETYVQPRDQIFQFYNFHKITARLTGTATAGLQILDLVLCIVCPILLLFFTEK
jgi:hypothetical protein